MIRKTIRILYVSTPYHPVGGAEKYLLLLCSGMRSRGHDVSVVLPNSPHLHAYASKLMLRNVHVHACNLLNRRYYKIPSILPSLNSRQINRFFNIYRHTRPDLIHTNQTDMEDCWPAIIAAKLAGKKLISTAHITETYQAMNSPFAEIRDLWVRLLYKLFRFPVITPSTYGKNVLIREYPVLERDVHVVHNGIEADEFRLTTDDHKFLAKRSIGKPECTVVGFFGRLTRQKSPELILQAARLLFHHEKALHFLFVGGGEEKSRLIEFCHEHGLLDHVTFWDHQSRIVPFMSLVDILVLPSRYENFPFVVLEAAYLEKPVVATNVGGIGEAVIHGETGFLTDHTAEGIAGAILFLLKHKEIAEMMGKKAKRNVVNHFSSDLMTAKTESLYYLILGNR